MTEKKISFKSIIAMVTGLIALIYLFGLASDYVVNMGHSYLALVAAILLILGIPFIFMIIGLIFEHKEKNKEK